MSARRILFVQYTNPAAYPPLEHSAQLLARAGWDVLFAGIESFGAHGLELRPHDRMRVERIGGRSGGALGVAKYAAFAARAAALARRFRPAWIYASDPLAAPAARLMRRLTGARVVYHEHDVASPSAGSRQRAFMRGRDRLIASAELLVVPGERRRRSLGAGGDRAHIVWNCPLLDEVSGAHAQHAGVSLVYAGSITPDRLPPSFIHALARLPHDVRLDLVGYATIGRPAYVAELLSEASRLGVRERVTYRGTLPRREQLLDALSRCDIGIATINAASPDENLRAMVGPSNKPFDYMARGLPFLVADDPAWRETFVRPGYALACTPAAPESIAAAVESLLDRDRRAAIGERARARIVSEWNYERQFAPVLAALGA
ncbi:MAG: glycosyltransferase family protein [Gemmatimonadota bacterium]